MTEEQALEELMFQSTRHEDIHNPRWENGFLGMLRPFTGKLYEANYHKIVASLMVLADSFRKKEIDRNTIACVMGIIHLGRAWAVYPEGILHASNRITPEQSKQVENWVENISYITFCLLDGCDDAVAFEFYESPKNE